MKKYPIKKIALLLAQFSVQEELCTRGRYVTHESDFSADELERVQQDQMAVMDILLASNGKPWHQTLTAVQTVLCPSLFIGFRLQDAIIKACKQCGIVPAPWTPIKR